MKVQASLESVKSKKNVTEDVIQTLVFNVWTSAENIGKLNELYRKPLLLTIEETQ